MQQTFGECEIEQQNVAKDAITNTVCFLFSFKHDDSEMLRWNLRLQSKFSVILDLDIFLCLYPHRILFYRNDAEIPFKEAKAATQLQYNIMANEEWNKQTNTAEHFFFFGFGVVKIGTHHCSNIIIFYKSCAHAESAEQYHHLPKSSYSFQSLTNQKKAKRTETIQFNKFCEKKKLHHSKSYKKAWEHYQRGQPNRSE